MKAISALSSLVIAAVVVASYLGETVLASWRDHQRAYASQLEELGVSAEVPSGPQQLFLPELDRVDRCVTCHLGVEDPRMAKAPQPLAAHPGDYLETHDVRRFGCTICHDGQGRALTAEDAHARVRSTHFDYPMLAAPFVEARCYRCHETELEQTPTFNAGRRSFESSGCLGCHAVAGKGGVTAPPLDGISDTAPAQKHPTAEQRDRLLELTGDNVNLAYLLEAVWAPGAQPPQSRMFDYGLEQREAIALAVYLKSLEIAQVTARDYVPRTRARPKDLAARGARLFGLYCSGCHGNAGAGGRANPNASAPMIPALAALNERLMLFEREDAKAVIEAMIAGDGTLPEDLDVPRANVVRANLESIWNVILGGNRSGMEDPDGPVPYDMPAWRGNLDRVELIEIIGYLLEVGEYEDDEDDDEDDDDGDEDDGGDGDDGDGGDGE